MAGYSAYRIFEETIRIDSSEHFLGLRLNFYVATIMTLIGIAWFVSAQRGAGWRPRRRRYQTPPASPGLPEPGSRDTHGPDDSLAAGDAAMGCR